jgi:predicted metal-binding protein
VGIHGSKEISEQQLAHLIDTAIGLGASDARPIFSSEIRIEEHLASLCSNAPRCENLGLSSSCPPHVQGPSAFRKWQRKSTFSLVVKIDLPTEIMFSIECRGIMQLLHEIVANVEREAIEMGFNETRAFAGGSCKHLFCEDHENCRVITGRGSCRNPDVARPSMSGFGINVTKLVQSAGWPLKMTHPKDASDNKSLSWVAGLILIAGPA